MIEVVKVSKAMTKKQMEQVIGINPLMWLYSECMRELGNIPEHATITLTVEYLEAK